MNDFKMALFLPKTLLPITSLHPLTRFDESGFRFDLQLRATETNSLLLPRIERELELASLL